MNIRPYQRQTIDKIRQDWRDGHQHVLITMATGGGKTIVFLQLLIEELRDNPTARCLILAHRKELIEQPIERLSAYWPEYAERAGIVMAERDECEKQIMIATVQTLNGAGRIERILAHGAVDYLITDEAHHATAASYISIYDRLAAANPRLKHLGVTATPLRADKVGLVRVFEKESAHYGIRELVKAGYLAPPRWLAIQTDISLSGVASNGSGDDKDFNQRQLSHVFETANCFELVVESHKKYAENRPAICFTVSVEGAHQLAEAFIAAGIPAGAADATTDKGTRAELLNRFRSGELSVLCNMGLWTEGLDLPELSCVHMVRPTQSDGLYTQCVGRALRIVPGKEDALILDYLPKESRNIAMLGDVLGVDIPRNHYIEPDAAMGEVAAGFLFDGRAFYWKSGNPMELISRQLDYLNLSPWRWIKPDRNDWAVIGLGKDKRSGVERALAVSPPDKIMQLWAIWKPEGDRWHKAAKLLEADLEAIMARSEEYIEKYGDAILAHKMRRWLTQPASERQIKYARSLGVWRDGMSKGEANDAITYRLSINAVYEHGGII
jgi:superfamily II DNA or RNA helicase